MKVTMLLCIFILLYSILFTLFCSYCIAQCLVHMIATSHIPADVSDFDFDIILVKFM